VSGRYTSQNHSAYSLALGVNKTASRIYPGFLVPLLSINMKRSSMQAKIPKSSPIGGWAIIHHLFPVCS
jgi:hypothetical protein